MTIKAHTHDVTLRTQAGASSSGLLLFHQVFQRNVSSPIQRHRKAEAPELWKPFCDGYEVGNHGHVRSLYQVLVNLLDSRQEPSKSFASSAWWRMRSFSIRTASAGCVTSTATRMTAMRTTWSGDNGR